jgi:hypothetical protein
MLFFRIRFKVPASLFAISLLLAFAMSGCRQSPVPPGGGPPPKVGAKNVKCTTKINVDPNADNGVDHKAVYVCDGDTLEWDNPHGATFTVHFLNDCPFSSCADITDSNARPIKPLPFDLTVYKYTITVNGQLHDPHVVGGGGA